MSEISVTEDVVKAGVVKTPDMKRQFPTLSEQQAAALPQIYTMDKSDHAPVVHNAQDTDAELLSKRGYVIVGGLTHVPSEAYVDLSGNTQQFEGHQELLKTQEFFTPHLSHLLGVNYNNPYGGKSVDLEVCAETHPMANILTLGSCVGVEHGFRRAVDDDMLIGRTGLVPKGELYIILSKEGLKPELKLGVESLPTPEGNYKPVLNAQVRFPFDFQ